MERLRDRAKREGVAEVGVSESFALLQWRKAVEGLVVESRKLVAVTESVVLASQVGRCEYWVAATADTYKALEKAHGKSKTIWGASAFSEWRKTTLAVQGLLTVLADVLGDDGIEKGGGNRTS